MALLPTWRISVSIPSFFKLINDHLQGAVGIAFLVGTAVECDYFFRGLFNNRFCALLVKKMERIFKEIA